jgi:hypothetical protein
VVRDLAERGVLGGVSLGRLYPGVEALENGLVVAVTETTTDEDIDALKRAEGGAGMNAPNQAAGGPKCRPKAASARGETVTGNRALMLEEPLMFEIGAPTSDRRRSARGRCPRRSRLGGLARASSAPIGLPACPSRRRCATTPACRGRITRSTSACSRSARAR